MSLLSAKAIKAISTVAAKAGIDKEYAGTLMTEAHAELAKAGFEVPQGVAIHFVDGDIPDSTDTDIYLNIVDLNSLADIELDEEKMAKVAGGASCQSTSSTVFSVPSCLSCSTTASSAYCGDVS